MTSKERVLTTIARSIPDRMPMDFGANAFVLARLKSELGAPTHRQLLDTLKADVVDLRGVVDPAFQGPVPKERWLPGGIKENYWGWRTKVMETAMGPEDEYAEFVLSGAQSIDELRAHPWPKVDWFDFTGFAERLDEWSDRAVLATGASIWQHPTLLRGLENMLADLITEPEMAAYLMDQFTDFYVAFFERMFQAAPGRIDILRIADDIGTQKGLLVGTEIFDTFFAPRLKRIIDMAHSHGVRVMFHSCGSIQPFIERLIVLGIDMLDPVQVSAVDMDPAVLKARFGSRLCFHGAIDTQHLLPNGTPEDVAAAVRHMRKTLGAGGGFILAPSHVFQVDVPTANILALYETGHACGAY